MTSPHLRISRTVAPWAPPLIALLIIAALATSLAAEPLYLTIAGAVAVSALAMPVGLTAEFGLLALVVVAGILALWSWRCDRDSFRRLVVGGIGVIGAYLSSEAIKLIVRQERPCRLLDNATVLACPEMGDWSWPSNHSVLAAAFAAAIVITAPRLAGFVAPVALLVGLARVGAGVHYLHDVFSGLALGVTVVVLTVVVAQLTALGTAPDGRRDAASERRNARTFRESEKVRAHDSRTERP